MNGGKMHGHSDMISKLKKFAEKYPDRVGSAMYEEGQIEMTESKRRCPVGETGGLRASGTVHKPERDGRKITVTMSYGGGTVGGSVGDIPIYVHENPDAHHRVGQWKYLESVINESRSSMASRIAARIHLSNVKPEEL
jgi:hypothetical protein